jgi:outer membrane protein assembly factor BamB
MRFCRSVPECRLLRTFLVFSALFIQSCGSDGPSGPEENDRLIWSYSAGSYGEEGIYYSSPALSPDESTVYVGTAGPANGQLGGTYDLLALDAATGALRWSFPIDSLDVRCSPAVAADGSVYFVAAARDLTVLHAAPDWLYCLDDDGALQWRYKIKRINFGGNIGNSSPAIGADGTIYVAGDSLFAIHPNGDLKWSAFLLSGEEIRNNPSVGPDGTVYIAYHNLSLSALDPDDGNILWQTPLDINDHCLSSPAVTASILHIANDQGYVYAVDPTTGAIDWAFYLPTDLGVGGHIRSSPSVDSDGTVYIGSSLDGVIARLLAIAPDGSLKWSFEPPDMPPGTDYTHSDIYSSPAIGSDGTVFVGQEMGRVYAIDPVDGSMVWKFETTHGIVCSPTLASDGTLYIADMNATVYALRTGCGGLKTVAPWPKYRHDAQNTGRF